MMKFIKKNCMYFIMQYYTIIIEINFDISEFKKYVPHYYTRVVKLIKLILCNDIR